MDIDCTIPSLSASTESPSTAHELRFIYHNEAAERTFNLFIEPWALARVMRARTGPSLVVLLRRSPKKYPISALASMNF